MRYRVNAPLMVLAFRDNHQAATTIPAGRIIDVLGLAEDDRFSLIRVDGEEFHVFEGDLAERGTFLMRKEPRMADLPQVTRAAS